MLRYIKRRTSCVQICADWIRLAYRCIHVSPAFRAKASTYPALPCVKHCGIVAPHKIIDSLPKQRTKDSDSQGTLSKTNLSSLHDLPLRWIFPQNYHRIHMLGYLTANCLHIDPERNSSGFLYSITTRP